jgi:hypothetical protein
MNARETPAPTAPPDARRSPWPFLAVLAVEAAIILALAAGRRGVLGRDAFQYFQIQYTFLSNALASGETAQWMPFMTHGTVSNWWYSVQAGLLQASLLALGPLNRVLEGTDFLPVYYAGILLDLALHLLGAVLLSRRYFKSDWTVLFVAVTSLGSTIYFTQPWWGLHFHAALPLILECLHRWIERRRWRYGVLAGNLLALQGLGRMPYQLPMIALTVCVYAVAYVILHRTSAAEAGRELISRRLRGAAALLLVAATLGLVFGALSAGTSEIVSYNPGRSESGAVDSLDSFLSYGSNRGARWHEALTRVSIHPDYSLYFGILALGFAALGLAGKPSRLQLLALAPAVVLFLVCLATPLASLLYHVFPMMKYFRHLALVSILVRMFLALLAGFGFERMLLREGKPPAQDALRFGGAALAALGLGIGLLCLSARPDAAAIVRGLSRGFLPYDPNAVEPEAVELALDQGAACALGAALFFGAQLWPRLRGRAAVLPAAVLLQAADLYAFKGSLADQRTAAMTAVESEVDVLQPPSYVTRRSEVDYGRHPRGRLVEQVRARGGVIYWNIDSYLFVDPPSNLGRTDHWLRPLDAYLRAFHGDPPLELRRIPRAFRLYDSLRFPGDIEAAGKLSGVSEDKVQFFSAAHPVPDDEAVRALLGRRDYPGDQLLVRAPGGAGPASPPGTDERVRRSYRVTRFDANTLELEVPEARAGDWLYYADVWHPGWRAWVNERETLVFRANLAYKAVPLETGANTVRFRFQSPGFGLSARLLNWNSLAWVLLLLGMTALEVRQAWRDRRRPDQGSPPPRTA